MAKILIQERKLRGLFCRACGRGVKSSIHLKIAAKIIGNKDSSETLLPMSGRHLESHRLMRKTFN